MPTPTRARLVEAARILFWERGYEASGMAEILKKANANSGSFYHFFKSKEDLLLAVLELYTKLLYPAVLERPFANTADPIERIFAVLGGYRQALEMTGCTYGCPIGRLAMEIDPARERVHQKISENFDGWIAAIQLCLDAAADRLPPDVDRRQLATFVLTVMEGGVMQSRAQRSLAPFDASVSQLRDYFDRLQKSNQGKSA